jgi:hypothetical protein
MPVLHGIVAQAFLPVLIVERLFHDCQQSNNCALAHVAGARLYSLPSDLPVLDPPSLSHPDFA